ncbi:DUF3995 domain-containing protein [Planomonospora sp. ID67723]|uniref:DUF3995 domain-containing protein n=1 Tax=Planomonospora sp. ID67723 TaxID=2738134 RepID=UPI0018C364E0|nr:DUF3995 domain-containing protein [Planomonospora sp. ID67723]MBG0826360.1 DUF3995 domain-containing protein [Planomonospora sp. ID67723]
MPDLTRSAAFVTATALLAVSGLHAVWATGRYWPLEDATAFARGVVGVESTGLLPSGGATAGVAVLLCCAAVLLLIRADALGPGVRRLAVRLPRRLIAVGCGVVAAVLLARGVGGLAMHLLGGSGQTPEEFVAWDRALYSPLCIGLGIGALLVLRGRRA